MLGSQGSDNGRELFCAESRLQFVRQVWELRKSETYSMIIRDMLWKLCRVRIGIVTNFLSDLRVLKIVNIVIPNM